MISRFLTLTYGGACYAAFLATFLYAIGFITGFGVPKTINSGAAGDFVESALINLALLGLFAAQHTVMARPAFKNVLTRVIPPPVERATFVLATCAVFLLLFIEWRPMPAVVWSFDGPVATILAAGSFVSFGVVLYSSFLINHFELFGLNQVLRSAFGSPPREARFGTPGLYKYVRHPLMLGFLIAFWSTPTMTVGHLLFAVACTGYIAVGVHFEERDLIRTHGERYLAYRRTTPAVLPYRRKTQKSGISQVEPA